MLAVAGDTSSTKVGLKVGVGVELEIVVSDLFVTHPPHLFSSTCFPPNVVFKLCPNMF